MGTCRIYARPGLTPRPTLTHQRLLSHIFLNLYFLALLSPFPPLPKVLTIAKGGELPGADDFLPAMILVVKRANPPHTKTRTATIVMIPWVVRTPPRSVRFHRNCRILPRVGRPGEQGQAPGMQLGRCDGSVSLAVLIVDDPRLSSQRRQGNQESDGAT